MSFLRLVLLQLALAWTNPLMVHSARILMIPIPMRSHFTLMTSVATELAKRNHRVDIYFLDSFAAPKGIENDLIHYITFKGNVSAETLHNIMLKHIQDSLEQNQDIMGTMVRMRNMTARACHDTLMDKDHYMEQLESNNYDLAISDNMFMMKCFYLIPHRLHLPIVSIVDVFEHWTAKLPWFPSVIPNALLQYTDRMSFKERLINTFFFLAMPLAPLGGSVSGDIIEKYSKYGPVESIDEVVMRTELWLYTYDVILDFVEPSMPNIVPVGGLALKPVQPLQSDLFDMISAWSNGFIVVSFGSEMLHLNPKYAVPMLDAFSKLDLLILWRLENRDKLEIPINVILMNWLPQHDLLAHENIKLFITHCGRSGLFEAIEHAVPMVAMPIFGDQPHNAKKVELKGFGEIVNLIKGDRKDILPTINKVLNDDSYKKRIVKASRMFNSRPEKPVERAASAIENILEFGGEHLRSVAFEMPWYQYWMVDILVFVLVIVYIVCYVMNKCIAALCRRCCSRKKEKQS